MEKKTGDNGITTAYRETETERQLVVRSGGGEATIAQNIEGYAMLAVRDDDDTELERYYGFDMALDHVGELLGVSPRAVPVPDAAADMGM